MTGKKEQSGERIRLLLVAPQYRKNNEVFFRCLNADPRLQTAVIWIRDFCDDDQPSEVFRSDIDFEIVGAKDIRVLDYSLADYRKLFRILRARIRQSDCVLTSTQCPVHSKFAYVLAKWYRKKLFVVVQQWAEDKKRGVLGRVYARLGYHILRRSDRAFVHGTPQQRFVMKLGVLPSRVALLPFLSDDLAKAPLTAPLLKSTLGLHGKRVILYFGRIMQQKGLEELIIAFKTVRERVDNVCLLVCGSGANIRDDPTGAYETRCRELARQVGDDVIFVGAIPPNEKQNYFAIADLFVHPHNTYRNLREGWGLVVNEACSMGLPVIATDRVPAAIDLVRDGKSGYIVESGNVQALTNRLTEILNDDDKLRTFGEESRRAFEAYHQVQRIADRIVEAAEK
jgi:glycosyltransferase involved in cell wall biosynthesis